MARKINGENLTNKDLLKIQSIARNSLGEYYTYLGEYDIEFYKDLQNANQTVILGDDWYINYIINDIYIKIEDFFACPGINRKRIWEIRDTLKYLLTISKEHIGIASLRHLTTYKLYCFLLKNNYLKEIDHKIDIDFLDFDEKETLIKEYNDNLSFSDLKNYSYLLHDVIFYCYNDHKENKENIKSLQYNWLKENGYIEN